MQAARAHGQGGGVALFARQARLRLRELLRQQLFGLQTQPGGVAAVLQGSDGGIGRGVVQIMQRLLQGPRRLMQLALQILQGGRRNGFLQQAGSLRLLQAVDHGPAQIGLRQLAR